MPAPNDFFFWREETRREYETPPERRVYGECARCGGNIYDDEVERGLSDGEICPDCREELEERNDEN